MSGRRSGSGVRVFGRPKMAALLFLGFASGLPLYLTSRTLQAWMTVEGVDLTAIGLFSLVALPYSLKFLWAPLLDRFAPPFLGRRRGWLLVSQVALLLLIAAMGLQDPGRALELLAVTSILVAFSSATQDIAVDAYGVDVLEERELGAGAAVKVLGYRIALLVTGSLALILADRIPWPAVYLLLSALMLAGIVATVRAPEPARPAPPPESLGQAIRLPFTEFFRRSGFGPAVAILAFVVLYRLGDALAGAMVTPFLLRLGFGPADVGALQGGLGLGAILVGTMIGGAAVARIGIHRSLWVFGATQAASNVAYFLLARAGQDYAFLVAALGIEHLCTGLANAAFVAYLMSLCDPRFSATQYALLTSLNGFSRDVLVAPAGAIAAAAGWPRYFLITLVAALPGLLLLPFAAPWRAAEAAPAGDIA